MFAPKYTISSELLANIKKISSLVTQLNAHTYSHIILHEFERKARDLSAHASTSIEGNPLPLTDVKALLKSRPEHIRDTQREVLNYNNALLWLEKEGRKQKQSALSHAFIHAIHEVPKNQTYNYQSHHHVNKRVYIHAQYSDYRLIRLKYVFST